MRRIWRWALLAAAVREMRRIWRWALLAAMLLLPAGRASAQAPDAEELNSLRAAVGSAPAVRVRDAGGVQVLRDVWLDSQGLVSARWGPGIHRPALIVDSESMPPAPRPLAWDQIASIEVGNRRTWKVAAGTAVFFGVVGAVIWHTIPLGYDGGQGDPAMVIGMTAASGFALGALVGHGSFSWKTVYPTSILSSR